MNSNDGSNGRPSLGQTLRDSEQEARALGAEVAGIASDLRLLVSKEVELGLAEVKEQAGFTVKGLILGAIGFLLADLLLVFVFVSLMFGLDTAMPLWAAALITTAVILLLTLVVLMIARSQIKKVTFKPDRMIHSLQEDMRWAKSQMKSSAR